MIKAEVVFDGDYIQFNGYEIVNIGDAYYVSHTGYFKTLEQAVAYCLEKSK